MSSNSLDFSELAEDLKDAGKHAEPQIMDLLEQFAEKIQADAQSYAPVDTGKLRSNILIKKTDDSVTVGVNLDTVPYAGFQEYGTQGPYEIRAKNKKALAFKVGGATVFRKKVMHPGVKAHPYIRPAMEQFLNELGPAAADVGVNLIGGKK